MPTCHQPAIQEKDLEIQVGELFQAVRLPDPLAEWLKKWIVTQHQNESANRLQDLERLQQEYANTQRLQDRLLDAFLKGLITEEEYQRRKREKEDETLLLREKIEGFEYRVKRWEESVIEAFDFSILPITEKTDPHVRKTWLAKIASKLILDNKKLSVEMKKPYQLVSQINLAVQADLESFETMKTRMDKKENSSLLDEFPLWRVRVHDVGTYFMTHPTSQLTI